MVLALALALALVNSEGGPSLREGVCSLSTAVGELGARDNGGIVAFATAALRTLMRCWL